MKGLLCALLFTDFIWQVTCRGTWNVSGQYEYYVSPGGDSRPYDEAQAYCNGQGGELALVKTQEVQQFIQSLVADNSGQPYGFFIGLRDIGANGTFIWNDGEALSYKNWKTGEPNNIDETCVIMGWIYTYDANLPWYNVKCTTKANGPRGFVCQRLNTSSIASSTTDRISSTSNEISTRTSEVTSDLTSSIVSTTSMPTDISSTQNTAHNTNDLTSSTRNTISMPTEISTTPNTEDTKDNTQLIIIVAAASASGVILLLLVIGIVIFCKHKNKNKDDVDDATELRKKNSNDLEGESNTAYMPASESSAHKVVEETYSVVSKKPNGKNKIVKESDEQDTHSTQNREETGVGQDTYSIMNKPQKKDDAVLHEVELGETYSSLNREGSNQKASDSTYSSLGENDATYSTATPIRPLSNVNENDSEYDTLHVTTQRAQNDSTYDVTNLPGSSIQTGRGGDENYSVIETEAGSTRNQQSDIYSTVDV